MVSSSISSCGLRFLFYSFLFQFQFPGGIHVYSDSPHQLFSTQVVLVLIPISSNIRKKIMYANFLCSNSSEYRCFFSAIRFSILSMAALFWGNDRRDLPVLGWVAWPWHFVWFHPWLVHENLLESTEIHWNPLLQSHANPIYNII